jgi:precorrin-2 dehydrogenase/sirohydrochlorin ferrochelatase
MALFPLFIDLAGRKCLVVGGGKVAVRKIERLLNFNAVVSVVSSRAEASIHTWAGQGLLNHQSREYCRADLEGAFLVIAATDDRMVNAAIDRDARARGLWVNIADDPGQGNFNFPALIQRDQLVIGISTSGCFPALSRRLRLKLEQELDSEWDGVLLELKRRRARINREVPDPQKRREILGEMAERLLTDLTRNP